jgi:predicted enzyme related to lactoylglutathione lyase
MADHTTTQTGLRHHTFDYVELAAPDIPAAKSFYAAAFGWEFNDYGPDYAGIRRPGGEGEMGGLNPERPAGPGLLESVRAAGGMIDEGPFECPGGRRFHFTDPAGNSLAAWSEA